MPPAFGVREHRIGFHDILERRRALGTDTVGMIEFREFSVGTQNISGGRRPWDAEDEVIKDTVTAKKPVGCPKSAPSTIINVRLPLTLVAELDRYLDQLERQTGLKANRGMIARRALECFLASYVAKATPGSEG
jgi:hypothetical protein